MFGNRSITKSDLHRTDVMRENRAARISNDYFGVNENFIVLDMLLCIKLEKSIRKKSLLLYTSVPVASALDVFACCL
jgi:hypothetical protein